MLQLHVQIPESLRLERLNFVHSLDAKRKSRRLTRAVRDQTAVQIAVLALKETRLKSSKCATNAQIKLLAHVDGQRLVLIGRDQSRHGLLDVLIGDGAEAGAQYGALERSSKFNIRNRGMKLAKQRSVQLRENAD